jgi:hypothetical protein
MLAVRNTSTGAILASFQALGWITAKAPGHDGLIVIGDTLGYVYFLRLQMPEA